jgi:hypothetical protein
MVISEAYYFFQNKERRIKNAGWGNWGFIDAENCGIFPQWLLDVSHQQKAILFHYILASCCVDLSIGLNPRPCYCNLTSDYTGCDATALLPHSTR